MSTAFQPMSTSEQAQFRAAYLGYLRSRDGVPDLKTQRFDVRERFFAELDRDPCCWVGAPPVDQATFDRNHARRTPEPGLDEATLWALATAKTNRGERYGVVKDALATIGLSMEVGQPGISTRAMVRAMVHLPEEYANVVVLCGEIVGVALFSLLLEKARVLFARQPRVLARIESLFGQIMVDEVGHVHFVRSGLGPQRLAWARRILPLVAWGVMQDIPELARLFGRGEIMRRAKAADVDAAAATYPDRFIFS